MARNRRNTAATMAAAGMFILGASPARTQTSDCAQGAPPRAANRPYESLLPAAPRWPDAIGGEEQVKDACGRVAASRSFRVEAEEAAADELMGQALSGARTPERLVPIQGVSFEDGVTRAYKYVLRVSPGAASEEDVPSSKAEEARALAAPEGVNNPPPTPVISPALASALAEAGPEDRLPVVVTLTTTPATSLARPFSTREASSFAAPAPSDRAQRIAERMAEVETLHAPLRRRLDSAGVETSRLRSLWLNGSLAGRLLRSEIVALSQDPEVRALGLSQTTAGSVANAWDGTNLSQGGNNGLNAERYSAGGWHGEGWNPVDGRRLRLGFVGDGFYFDHAVFRDYVNGPSRFIKNWDCRTESCVEIYSPLGTGIHETLVSSAAGGDALQDQVPGITDPADKRDHTGVAKEVEMYSAEGTSEDTMIAALQTMIAAGVDVVSFSRGDYGDSPSTCDYDATVDNWSTAVKNAHDAGVLVVTAAGNIPNAAGTCSVTRWAQATSAMVVGSTQDPVNNGYSTVGRDNVAKGPMNATVYGYGGWVPRTDVLSAIGVLVPGHWFYGASTPDNFVQTGGTSLAAPQVAGAAMLVKNAFLGSGLTYIDSPGVLYTTLLSMTDRATAGSPRTSAFDPAWGAGRFQLRYFMSGADHPAGGAWSLELSEVMIHNGESIDLPVRGTAPEPSAIQQFKVYAVVFENSWRTVADVDISVRDQNCAGTTLGSDASYDTKSMVRLGSAAAGKALCVRVKGYAVPPEGRRVVLATYYSVDTAMR